MSVRFGKLCKNFNRLVIDQRMKYSMAAHKRDKSGPLLISCKRKQFDHYSNVVYDKLDEVPLASKGWTHSKSKGDYFVVHPLEHDHGEPTYPFKEFNIHPSMVDVLKDQGIKRATEFQYQAIKAIQKDSHTMLAAETGCGKTLSYILPIIEHIRENKATGLNTPKAVVLVPNRELAYQVGEFAETIAKSVDVNVKIVVGGRTKSMMMNPTFTDIDILVGTPGAIGKLSTVGIYKLHEARYTVLDEADTLLDDSFIDRLTALLKRLSQSQIILVSATLPRSIPEFLAPIEPTLQQIVSPRIHRPLLNVTQRFARWNMSEKPGQLLQIAKSNKDPMLIFTNKNQTCNWVALFLRENGVACSNINGDMNYAIRIDQWNQFIRGDTQILSATDVGSRGLNTIHVKHVLNYDFPLYAADYLHRIGRVGRIGSPLSCKVTNFVAGEQEVMMVQQIELAIRRNQPITNVDGNITNIVQRKIEKKKREAL